MVFEFSLNYRTQLPALSHPHYILNNKILITWISNFLQQTSVLSKIDCSKNNLDKQDNYQCIFIFIAHRVVESSHSCICLWLILCIWYRIILIWHFQLVFTFCQRHEGRELTICFHHCLKDFCHQKDLLLFVYLSNTQVSLWVELEIMLFFLFDLFSFLFNHIRLDRLIQ